VLPQGETATKNAERIEILPLLYISLDSKYPKTINKSPAQAEGSLTEIHLSQINI